MSLYVLSIFQKKSMYSIESGLKYFISNSLISCFYLLGCLFLYSLLGTLTFNEILLILSIDSYFDHTLLNKMIACSFFLITITILFKIVIAPFHFWFPQIYDGSPIASTIIFSVIPKFSFIIIFLRLNFIFNSSLNYLDTFFFIIGLYSIYYGCFLGLEQKRLKKLLIYSSISQLGFPVCVIAENTTSSSFAVLNFILIYLAIAYLTWSLYVEACTNLRFFAKKTLQKKSPLFLNVYLSMFTQVFKINKSFALLLLLLFFSLMGMPPFLGFLSKFFIFSTLLEYSNYTGIFCMCILSMFSTFLYLQSIKISFFESKQKYTHLNLQSQSSTNNSYIASWFFSILLFILFFQCFFPDLLILYLQHVLINFY